jgi:hypothetical protein
MSEWDAFPTAAQAPAAPQAASAWDAFPAAPMPSVGADIAKGGGIGLAQGVIGLAGLPGDTRALAMLGASKALAALGMPQEHIDYANKVLSESAPGGGPLFGPTSSDIQSKIENVTGPFYQPQTVPGQYARTAGQFIPAAIGGEEALIPRLIKQALVPAAVSETAGQATKGTSAEPYARIGGAILGGVGAAAVPNIARRIVTPLPATPARQAAVQTLAAEGVPVTAGQVTGSPALRYLESSLGDAPFAGGQATRAAEQQAEAFTAATLRRAGENATRATPQVVDQAFTRIGNEFDRLAANNTMQVDRRLGNDLRTAELEYNRLTPPNARAPVVNEMINDIQNIAAQNGGALPGAQYQAFRSRLDRAARATRADPQLSGALFDVRNSLDDAMQRSIRPQDRGAWQEVRRQYRNMLVIEKAVTGAGENTAQGLISPAALRNATVGQNRRSYARGQGDFADLAHAGESLLKPLPQSGTAPRAFAAAIPAIVGAGIAGGPGAAIGAGTSVVAPGLAGRVLMSRPVQAYLANQALPPVPQNQLSLLRRALLTSPATLPARFAFPQISSPQQ